MDMSLSKLRVFAMDREACCAAVHVVTKSQTWLRDWSELNQIRMYFSKYWKVKALVFQSFPTLCYPMECSPPGFSVWNSPGKNIGLGAFLSPGHLPNPGMNPGLMHCRLIVYHLSHQGSPAGEMKRLVVLLEDKVYFSCIVFVLCVFVPECVCFIKSIKILP